MRAMPIDRCGISNPTSIRKAVRYKGASLLMEVLSCRLGLFLILFRSTLRTLMVPYPHQTFSFSAVSQDGWGYVTEMFWLGLEKGCVGG
jgi:hypothetical protein